LYPRIITFLKIKGNTFTQNKVSSETERVDYCCIGAILNTNKEKTQLHIYKLTRHILHQQYV
jgi:hypothetical protein